MRNLNDQYEEARALAYLVVAIVLICAVLVGLGVVLLINI